MNDAESILRELVRLQELKAEELRLRQRRVVSIERNREALAQVNAMRTEYNEAAPKAWKRAKFLLNEIDGRRSLDNILR